jgi:hypothetical protein
MLLEQPAALITLEASSAFSVPQTACIARERKRAACKRRTAPSSTCRGSPPRAAWDIRRNATSHAAPCFLAPHVDDCSSGACVGCVFPDCRGQGGRPLPPTLTPRTARPGGGSVSLPIDCTRLYGLGPRRYVQPSAAHGHDAASPPRGSRRPPRGSHRCSARRGVVSRWSVSAPHVSGAGGDCPTRRGQGAQPRPPQSDRPTLRCAAARPAAHPPAVRGTVGNAPMAMAVLARLLRGVC